MADLAKYVVSLEAETRKYQSKLDQANKRLKRFEDQNKKSLAGITKSFRTFETAIAGIGVTLLARSIADAGIQMQQFERALKVATGSVDGAQREMRFIRQVADDLGLSLQTTAQSFAKLAASSKGTALEGKATRDIFVAVNEAARVLGLTTEQTSGALTAIEQIISKGKVSAEELRGQLGERLPGAFQIAARAIGVTTSQLDEMLRKGELTAEDLLPALATELHNTFGPEVENAANDAQGAINRFSTAIFDLKVAIAESGVLNALASLARITGTVADIFRVAITDPEVFPFEKQIQALTQERNRLLQRIEGLSRPGAREDGLLGDFVRWLKGTPGLEESLAQARQRVAELTEEIERLERLQLETGFGGAAPAVSLEPFNLDALEAKRKAGLQSIQAELQKAIEASEKNIDRLFDHFVDSYATAEQEVAAEMERFDMVAHLFPPEEQERIRQAIRSPLFEGLEEFDIAEMESRHSEFLSNRARQLREELDRIKTTSDEIGLTFASAFEDAIVQARSLRDIVHGLLQDILRIIIRKSVTNPLADFIGGLFGGARAMGGPVAGGVPYLVGERGPELFVPAAAGRIVPNNAIGGQIVQHFHVQAGLPPQWEAQLGAVTQIAAASARESVSRELGGRR